MTNEHLLKFASKQKMLTEIIGDASKHVEVLDMQSCAKGLKQLCEKMSSESFKIMVMGNFKNGKSTFINALLGQEVLPAYAVPTTAIINEVKYGDVPRAILHFLNPQPAQMYDGIPEKALEHMKKFENEYIPSIEMPVDEIEDYVVIPMGMDHKEASKQSPFEKVELFWPLELLKNGVEIIDSPGLNENPVRTQVTLEYLSKADAIVFVFSALAMGSKAEIDYIEDTLHRNGIGEQNLFCVVNRFDQVQENQRQRLMKFTNNLLEPYTKHIYYTSGYNALMGKLNNDMAMLEASNIPTLEANMIDFLTHERGRIKLATPARELSRTIRKEILEKAIPEKRNALSTDLSELKKRYNEAQPEFDKLRQQRDVIISRAEAYIANMIPDIRRAAVMFFNNLPAQIRAWVDEYVPETEVSMFHLKRDTEVLVNEITDYLNSKIDAETRNWIYNSFAVLLADKIQALKDSLEGRLGEFYVSLDQVKLGINGGQTVEQEEAPTWQRIAAAGSGILFGGLDVAIVGGQQGFNAEFAKSLAIKVGGMVLLSFLGLWNPVTLVALLVANFIRSAISTSNSAVEKAKQSISDQYCEEINKGSMDMVESAVNGAMDNFNQIKEILMNSMSTEIDEMQHQIESIIRDVEQGSAAVEKKTKEISECEEKLQTLADTLDTFIFDLLK